MKILQICPRVPFPETDGGSIAMLQVYKGLAAKGHDVTCLCLNTQKHFVKKENLRDVGKFELVNIDTKISKFKALINLFSKQPYILKRFFSSDFEQKLKSLLTENNYDVVQFEGTYAALYVDLVKEYSKCKTVLRVHNLEHRIWKNLANHESGIKKWYYNHTSKGLELYERSQFQKFDGIASISPIETDLLNDKLKGGYGQLKTIAAGIDLNQVSNTNTAKPKSFFILGSMNWIPNQEGLNWFLKNVWHQALSNHRDIELHVAGTGMPKEIRNQRIKNVIFHGFVESAEEFRNSYDVMLVPLLSGGGMRIKILEGMAQSKAIISTSKGSEGIEIENDKHLIVADTKDEWLRAIDLMLSDNKTKKLMEKNAGLVIKEKYSIETVIKDFEQLYSSIND